MLYLCIPWDFIGHSGWGRTPWCWEMVGKRVYWMLEVKPKETTGMPILTKGCIVQLSCSHNESYWSLHGSKFPFSLAKEQNKSVCLIGQQTHLKFIWRANAICQGTWTAKQIVLKSEYEFSFGFRKSIGGTDRGWIHIALLINLLLYPFQHCKSTL